MKHLLILAVLSASLMAAQSRTVNVSWTPSTTTGITGVAISTGTSATGPFTFKACVGAVTGQTCISGSTSSTTTYADTEAVGTTVFYQVVAFAAACTPTTPATTACGSSVAAVASTTVPQQPGISTVVLVVP
jgi:hypothetical protein